MNGDLQHTEQHLRVFADHSEYVSEDGRITIFMEGVSSVDAQKRIRKIKVELAGAFLDKMIIELKDGRDSVELSRVSSNAQASLSSLVESVTSEVGRALIGITVMQLCIKSIVPEQSVRLHKASTSTGSFSWVEGVSMRTLDKEYVTPALRRHDLVRLNADGFMMTRSLAENYPYSPLYKANMRGAKLEWLTIVEELETGSTDPRESLKYLLSLLLNAANSFTSEASELIRLLETKIGRFRTKDTVVNLLKSHADASDYAARLMEISMHALLQAAVESGAYGDWTLAPLSQMRSANKKHGNIGDIELLEGKEIKVSWDAKYGKSYLREEIEEVAEKIEDHSSVLLVGFVTNAKIIRTAEISERIDVLTAFYGVDFRILEYDEWVTEIYNYCIASQSITEEVLSQEWIRAYALTLAQRKRLIAPVDEPCMRWIQLLREAIDRA